MAVVFCNNCGAGNSSGGKFCFACGQKLQQGVAPTPATLTGLLPSHTLLKQRYRILQAVGKGGMGAVYMAQDNTLGDRLVAIKEMSQAMLSPQEAQNASNNFKKEAYLLAGLHHPNLPSIHDHFEEQGRWYLVMSFIEGETLEDYMKGKLGEKVDLEEGLQIGLVLCDVLDFLHAHRPPIIFRDLKPSNIMRTSQGRIYLIDFGIARHFKPGQAKDTANYGSAGFSPPEQYGRAQTSPRSDIYSLGATLYYVLSGYSPSLSPFRLPPLQSKVPGLPSGLVALITQMLSLDESMRPTNIQEVKSGLERFTSAQVSMLQKGLAPTMPTSTPSPPQGPVNIPPPQATFAQQKKITKVPPVQTQSSSSQRQVQATVFSSTKSYPASLKFFILFGIATTAIGFFALFMNFSSGSLLLLLGAIFLAIAATMKSNTAFKKFFTCLGIVMLMATFFAPFFHIGSYFILLTTILIGVIFLLVVIFRK